jgi:glycosyltransferase involved in cell wall biosynthesis
MKERDFIFTGLQSWDIPIGSNAIDIAKEISLDNRVLYVNSALDLMTLLRNQPTPELNHRLEVIKKRKPTLRKITSSLWVLDFPFWVWSVNGLPDGFIFDFFNKLNSRRIFSYIRKVAFDLGFTNTIHFIDNDIYRSMYSREYLMPKLSVYYRRDNLHPMRYWKNHAVRLEPLIISKSDLVLCNSPQLAEYARKFNPESYDVGQGVDLSAYDVSKDFQIPDSLKFINGRRIGYIGDINSTRLDANLIYELARNMPDYSFVMIGKEDNLFASHEMHRLKNIHFIGSVPKNLVPQYMHALEVCLNPQIVNEITIGNYPRKVDEYLAMGKPVIATATGTMALFRDHVYLCSSFSEYKSAIEKALIENNDQKVRERIMFAQTHTWKNNVERIYKHIEEMLK